MVWPCFKIFWSIKDNPVKGKRKRGRQKKRWEGNIKEWTGMDFASSTRTAENRTRWKGIVANSSVVPRRPSKVMGQNRIDRIFFKATFLHFDSFLILISQKCVGWMPREVLYEMWD